MITYLILHNARQSRQIHSQDQQGGFLIAAVKLCKRDTDKTLYVCEDTGKQKLTLTQEGCRGTSGDRSDGAQNKSVLKSFLQTPMSTLVHLTLLKILEILPDTILVAVGILISAFCT